MRLLKFVCVLSLLWIRSSFADPVGRPVTIGFDGFGDLAVPQTELGVTFTGATVLTCGGSLNCPAYPPFSGRNVIYDQPGFGGAITATFDLTSTGFVGTVTARVTGLQAITLTAYSQDGTIIDSDTTGGRNCICSGAVGPPNKLLTVESSDPAVSIAKVVFKDTGNTFTVDDFTFYSQIVKIVIDAGHGLYTKADGNKSYQRVPPTANFGLTEDLLTLDMALAAQQALEASGIPGLQVVQTRRTEATHLGANHVCIPKGTTVCPLDVVARKKFAESEEADIFVSIHTNGFSDPTANGTEAFWMPTGKSAEDSDRSKELAGALNDEVIAKLGTRQRLPRAKMEFRAVVQNAYMPTSLIEVAFHSNTQLAVGQAITDEEILANPANRTAAAQGIADAIITMVRKILEQTDEP